MYQVICTPCECLNRFSKYIKNYNLLDTFFVFDISIGYTKKINKPLCIRVKLYTPVLTWTFLL